jgi:sec-independent protein translocase protein TatC
MTFNYYKYYTEIKNRLFLLLVSWLLCFNVCYYHKEIILFVLINSNSSFLEFSSVNNKPYFIITNITEVFYVYFEIIVFVSNQVAVFILIYQGFMFLSSGLYQFEFTKLKLLLQLLFTACIFSIILLIKFIIPLSWKFFLNFQENSTNQTVFFFFEAKLSEYLEYFISLYYICLISCQFLVLLLIVLTSLSKNFKAIKIFRRIFYLTFIVFSTLVTPPDILSQILICSILILIYEFMIFLKGIKISMVTN